MFQLRLAALALLVGSTGEDHGATGRQRYEGSEAFLLQPVQRRGLPERAGRAVSFVYPKTYATNNNEEKGLRVV